MKSVLFPRAARVGELMRPRLTAALVCLVVCFVITPANADGTCTRPGEAPRTCLLPGSYDRAMRAARIKRENRHRSGSRAAHAEWPTSERWQLGDGRDAKMKFGFVRKGERSDFSITKKGLRIALKF